MWSIPHINNTTMSAQTCDGQLRIAAQPAVYHASSTVPCSISFDTLSDDEWQPTSPTTPFFVHCSLMTNSAYRRKATDQPSAFRWTREGNSFLMTCTGRVSDRLARRKDQIPKWHFQINSFSADSARDMQSMPGRLTSAASACVPLFASSPVNGSCSFRRVAEYSRFPLLPRDAALPRRF